MNEILVVYLSLMSEMRITTICKATTSAGSNLIICKRRIGILCFERTFSTTLLSKANSSIESYALSF